jgi:hypothetical protein
MLKKLSLLAFAVFTLGFASAPRATAGVEMVEPEYEPAPRYSYVPPPPPPPAVIYYAPPPPVRIYVEPSYAYVDVRHRVYRHRPRFHHHRFHGRRGQWHRGYRR